MKQCQVLAIAALVVACLGCCNEQVWRCPSGQCSALSGRFDGCSDCNQCDVCGQAPGACRCSVGAAFKNRITCGEGCGEVYFDEWWSDPPVPCDPCNECTGQFVGRRCCPPPWRFRNDAMLLGGRCDSGCCESGSCQQGSQMQYQEHEGPAMHYETAPSKAMPVPMPTEARRTSTRYAR